MAIVEGSYFGTFVLFFNFGVDLLLVVGRLCDL